MNIALMDLTEEEGPTSISHIFKDLTQNTPSLSLVFFSTLTEAETYLLKTLPDILFITLTQGSPPQEMRMKKLQTIFPTRLVPTIYIYLDISHHESEKIQQIPHAFFLTKDDLTWPKIATLIAQAQAETDLKNLKEKCNELEHFAGVITHDLNAPLSKSLMMINLIENDTKSTLSEESKALFSRLLANTTQMISFIDELRSFTKINRSFKPLIFTSLTQCIHRVLQNLEVEITMAQAHINYESLPTIMGDFGSLMQLFQNLISNALKYNDKERPILKIYAERVKQKWHITLKDNGPGIPQEKQGEVFKPFVRLHSDQQKAGMGLGLYVCKNIVSHHGGEIWITSTPGKETLVHLVFNSICPTCVVRKEGCP